MSSCCNQTKENTEVKSSAPSVEAAPCCGSATKKSNDSSHCGDQQSSATASCCSPDKQRFDYMLWVSLVIVLIFYPLHWLISDGNFAAFSVAVFDLANSMAWGVALGILMVAILAKVPREFVMSIMGTHSGIRGLLRATGAGLLLDLCNHGILLVGAKLYERGASIGQVMAFLIASPWNSLSLTLILIALIGLPWTLAFIFLSAVIALTTGLIFDRLVTKGVLPPNPNKHDLPEDFRFWYEAKKQLKESRWHYGSLGRFALDGIKESRMVIRWLLVGIILAALVRVFVPEDIFGSYFGPTLIGLGVTLLVATVLEVCSEGSTPIAADIFNRAFAPGNSFAFLMTGAATDYTEVMVLKDVTKSWKIALFLPLISTPQVVLLALILNSVGT